MALLLRILIEHFYFFFGTVKMDKDSYKYVEENFKLAVKTVA